jgi:hypothetical protein
MKTLENTIVAFHIGRGGRFNNSGFKTFIGEEEIGKFTNDLSSSYENAGKFKNRFGFDATYRSGQKCIVDLITEELFEELEEAFGIKLEELGELQYSDNAGNPVGLTQKEIDSGVGRIDIDGGYNTTYTCYLKDCSEEEIELIKESGYWNKNELLELLGQNEFFVISFDSGAKGERYVNDSDYGCSDPYSATRFDSIKEAESYKVKYDYAPASEVISSLNI